MRGRQMHGWLRVGTEDVRTKRELAKWVELGATFARSLAREEVTLANAQDLDELLEALRG